MKQVYAVWNTTNIVGPTGTTLSHEISFMRESLVRVPFSLHNFSNLISFTTRFEPHPF